MPIPLSIKLRRDHIPIHQGIKIESQMDYDIYMSMLLYLMDQVDRGFKPGYLVTWHYQHPTEHGKVIKETSRLNSIDRLSFKTKRSLWNEVGLYNHFEKKRRDLDSVVTDTKKIKNLMLQHLYGIKRLNQEWKGNYPNLFFFHEWGKVKLQLHTHALLPSEGLNSNDIEDIRQILSTSIRNRVQCLSMWKPVHITSVHNVQGIMNYLNKETTANHIPLDFQNSNPILEAKTYGKKKDTTLVQQRHRTHIR